MNHRLEDKNNHYKVLITILCTTLILSLILALWFGAVAINITNIFIENTHNSLNSIILNLRLPRILLAALVGALLAACGVIMQALFRNPLADPSLIGVTAGASLGASVSIFFASHILSNAFISYFFTEFIVISIGAFSGGIIAVSLVYTLAKRNRYNATSVSTMLLAGIAIGALAAGVSSLLDFYANNDTLRRLSLWRMGSMDGASYVAVAIMTMFLVFFLIIKNRYADILNALLLGESQARFLGIDTDKITKQLIIFVTLVTAVSVALCGTISFVGLIVPHMMRTITGANHHRLLNTCLMAGAILLVSADLISRILSPPIQFPIGIITALIGAPFFLSILAKNIHKA